MSVICLKAYRENKTVKLLGVWAELPETPSWSFEAIKEMCRARFRDDMPPRVEAAWKKKSKEPYAFGCVHNIQWSPERKKGEKAGTWNRPYPFAMDMDPNASIIGAKVEAGGTDPCAWMDMKYGVTLNHIKNRSGKKLEIHTRSDLIAHDDYEVELDAANHTVYIYAQKADADTSRSIEPGAPSTARRLKAYRKLRDAGINVHLIWQNERGERVLSVQEA